jgi:hypothetical protein
MIIPMVVIGIGSMIMSGFYGFKYANIPTKFDYVLYEEWFYRYTQYHPYAVTEFYEKYNREHPNSASTDPPLKDLFLNRMLWRKRCIVIFATVGGVLTTIGAIFSI